MNYNGTRPIGGDVKTAPITAAAGTYYVGMPLAFNAANGSYDYSATEIQAVAWEEKTLSVDGALLCAVTGSEILRSGLVDGQNAAITLTDADVSAAARNGIILR